MAYISREKAIEIIKSGGYWEQEDMEVAVACIEQTPTADVVEVVRCKDCKHCQKVQGEWDNDWYFCLNSANNKSVEATAFCSYGERK